MLSGLAAAIATGDDTDFDTGADRAATVYRYNYLAHLGRVERDSLLRKAATGDLTDAQRARLAELNLKDALSDEALIKACMNDSADECKAARKDAQAKADTYPNLGYQNPKESLAGYQQIERLLAGTTEEAIQVQRLYDGLIASFQRMDMSAENAKTWVGYQLGALYIAGGIAGANAMAALEKGLALKPQAGNIPKGVSTVVEPKIAQQMGKRGWTADSLESVISNPSKTVVTKDTRFDPVSGSRLNDPATGYIAKDGSYVVRNDRTGAIVQVSDKNDKNWVAPWD